VSPTLSARKFTTADKSEKENKFSPSWLKKMMRCDPVPQKDPVLRPNP